jgi:hypothetical protein
MEDATAIQVLAEEHLVSAPDLEGNLTNKVTIYYR